MNQTGFPPVPFYTEPAKSAAEVLRRADAILCNEQRWIRHTKAKDVRHYRIDLWHIDAIRFCLIGAMERASVDSFSPSILEAMGIVKALLKDPFDCISWFNDFPDTSFADVKAMLAKAIAKAEEQDALDGIQREGK